jgi:hypothetical protein
VLGGGRLRILLAAVKGKPAVAPLSAKPGDPSPARHWPPFRIATDRFHDLGFAMEASVDDRTAVRRHAHKRDTADRTWFCRGAWFIHD